MVLSVVIVIRHVLPRQIVGPKRLALPVPRAFDVHRNGKPIASIDLVKRGKCVVAGNHAAIGNAVVNVSIDQLMSPIPHPNGMARAISHAGSVAIARKSFVTAPVAMSGFNRQLVRL